MNQELFPEFESSSTSPPKPLAERMRPSSWEDLVGHEQLVGSASPLRLLIEKDTGLSFILWGPPGSGKTTIARIVAQITQSVFHELSAVNAGVADIRKVIEAAQKHWRSQGKRTILFIDEIHRFNKAQQDAVLPHIENGTLRLIGSTTENPSFEVIPALRSRCQIFRLGALTTDHIRALLERALADKDRGLGEEVPQVEDEALNLIISHANGDARRALNVLEASIEAHSRAETKTESLQKSTVEGIIQQVAVLYDKDGTEHYDHASAFQKSLRGSDADASVYWLAKMIAGGEDPRFIARRLVITASEDVGNADPMALVLANAAALAVERIGLPEARIPLAQAVIYVARAPKDNSAIIAVDSALAEINHRGGSYPVPEHLKDTHYQDAKTLHGFGKDYRYPHDYPNAEVEQDYLPPELKGKRFVPEPNNNKQ